MEFITLFLVANFEFLNRFRNSLAEFYFDPDPERDIQIMISYEVLGAKFLHEFVCPSLGHSEAHSQTYIIKRQF